MKTNIQKMLGLRTNCCGAKIVYWHHDKPFCESCERWLATSANALKQSGHSWRSHSNVKQTPKTSAL